MSHFTQQNSKETPAGREVIFVLGMSRSGTSAITRLLSLCGGVLPHNLLPASNYNPTGYWESVRAKEINDAFLAAHSSSWSDAMLQLQIEPVSTASRRAFIEDIAKLIESEFGESQTILLKDPRIAVLFPFWRDALAELGFSIKVVHIFRHPNDVSASLLVRNSIPAVLAQALWLKANLIAERDGRGLSRVFVSYEDVQRDWEQVISYCIDVLKLGLAVTAGTRLAAEGFLSRSLWHHESVADDRVDDSSPGLWITKTYELLVQAKCGQLDIAAADVIRGEYQAHIRSIRWPGAVADAWRPAIPRRLPSPTRLYVRTDNLLEFPWRTVGATAITATPQSRHSEFPPIKLLESGVHGTHGMHTRLMSQNGAERLRGVLLIRTVEVEGVRIRFEDANRRQANWWMDIHSGQIRSDPINSLTARVMSGERILVEFDFESSQMRPPHSMGIFILERGFLQEYEGNPNRGIILEYFGTDLSPENSSRYK